MFVQHIIKKLKKTAVFLPFFFCLICGTVFISLNITGYNLTHYPGDLGDGRLNNYFLEHAWKFLSGQEKSLWDAPFMYPEKKVLSYSDNLLGTAPFYGIFRMLRFDRETAYQLWFLLMAILSYLACYFFLKLTFKNKYAAALGAFVFAFSIALQSQMTHAQTFTRFPIPFALSMLILFSRDFKPVYFFLALFAVVYQIYCGIYLGLLLMVPVSIMLLLILVLNQQKIKPFLSQKKWFAQLFVSALINVLFLLPLILPYVERSKMLGMNTYAYVLTTVPTPASHVYSQPGSLFWDFLSETGKNIPAFWDHQLFAGAFATCCLIYFFIKTSIRNPSKKQLIPIPDRTIQVLSITGIVTFLLFMRVETLSLYKLIYHLPGFGSMRSLTRIINIELIFFAIATAWCTTKFLEKAGRFQLFWFLLLGCILVADNYMKTGRAYRREKKETQARVEALMEKMKTLPKKSVISYEPENGNTDCVAYQIDAMLATQALGLVCVNGYTATSPGTYTPFWMGLDSVSRKYWFKENNMTDDHVQIIH
jgi:hypothetical protein